MSTTRVYYVLQHNPGQQPTARLIEATNVMQATRLAAQSTFAVRLASQDDLIQALSAGVTVERPAILPVQAEFDDDGLPVEKEKYVAKKAA